MGRGALRTSEEVMRLHWISEEFWYHLVQAVSDHLAFVGVVSSCQIYSTWAGFGLFWEVNLTCGSQAFIATLLFYLSMSVLPIIKTQKSQTIGLFTQVLTFEYKLWRHDISFFRFDECSPVSSAFLMIHKDVVDSHKLTEFWKSCAAGASMGSCMFT